MGDVIGPINQTPFERKMNWTTMLQLKQNIYDMQLEDREKYAESIKRHQEALELYLGEYAKSSR